MLVLLVITPMLFNEALDIQETVVTNNLITGIFSDAPVGSTSTSSDYKKVAKDSSRKMKDLVIGSLIYPDPAIADFNEADKKYEKKNNCGGKCEKAVDAYNKMLVPTGDGMKYTILSKYVGVTEKVDDEEIFVYNYQMFLTLICAGFIVYILLSFSFDLAKRFIELNLLMVLSPLFIATYIDPKSAKSGPFNNWLKAVGKSYVGLFLRLGALAVMLLFIKIISSEELDTSSLGFIGKIILLFAALTFCKNIPKWLGDLLGTGDAMGGLGLGKKIEDTPFVGKGLMGAARKAGHMASGAAVGAAVGAAKGGYNTLKDRSKRRGEAGLGYFRNRDKTGMDKEALRNARQQAYARDGNAANGGFFKQMGAGMLGAGLAGGRTGVKADNIKGAFQGSVKAADNFGKTVGNRGGTVKEWVGDKLDIAAAGITAMYGSPSDLSEQREEIENNKKASVVVAGGKAGKYSKNKESLEAGEVAVGKVAQEKIQMHAATKSKVIERDADGNEVVVQPDEKQRFAMTKAYQAASFAFGESKVQGVTLEGNAIKVSLDGVSTPLEVSLDDAKNGKFGAKFNGASSFGETNEGAKLFNTTYYESQQRTLQTSEKYAESDRRLAESLSTLSSTINSLKTDFASKIPAGANGFKTVFDEAIASLTAEERKSSVNIMRALEEKGTNAGWSEDAIEAAKYIARQEEREASLKSEHGVVLEKLKETESYIKTWIDGGDSNEKAIKVEKAISDAKGLVVTASEDEK